MKTKKMGYILTAFLAIVLVSGTAVQAEQREIKFGVMQWENISLPSQVIMDVLRDRFGYKVTPVEMFEWGIAYAALAKGDIDLLLCEINFVVHDFWKRSKDKLEKIGPSTYGEYQGLMVPPYVPVNSISELNDYKDKFDGRIIGIEPGSQAVKSTKQAIKEYNLDFQVVEGSTAAMVASLKSAVDKKKWIVVTCWRPFWPTYRYNLKFLEDPKNLFMAYGPETQYVIATKGFTERNPLASQIMRSIFIPVAEIDKMSLWVYEGKTVQESAKKWAEENKPWVDRWCVIGGVE